MNGEEDPAAPPPPLRDDELIVLRQRTRHLEARRGRITAKKVYLKNKKASTDTSQPIRRVDQFLLVNVSLITFFLSFIGNLYRQPQSEAAAAPRQPSWLQFSSSTDTGKAYKPYMDSSDKWTKQLLFEVV